MKAIFPILTVLILAIPAQATSTARQIQLESMRNRAFAMSYPSCRSSVWNDNYVDPGRGGIGHFRYNYQSAREIRSTRRYYQNSHRRQWQRNRNNRRYYRSRLR